MKFRTFIIMNFHLDKFKNDLVNKAIIVTRMPNKIQWSIHKRINEIWLFSLAKRVLITNHEHGYKLVLKSFVRSCSPPVSEVASRDFICSIDKMSQNFNVIDSEIVENAGSDCDGSCRSKTNTLSIRTKQSEKTDTVLSWIWKNISAIILWDTECGNVKLRFSFESKEKITFL